LRGLKVLDDGESMKKATKKKQKVNKAKPPAKKRAASKPARSAAKKSAVAAKKTSRPTAPQATPSSDTGDKLSFNHAMIYLKDVGGGIDFYRSWLGFRLIEDYRHEGKSVYARLQAPGGNGTIALHQAGPGASVASDGVRLYFEVRELDTFCQKLRNRGFVFTQQPQMMPWGWRHAYLNDPEGHEISLYWAGEQRMQKSVMKAAKQAGTGSR
jgi:catechol 2,3-dioxygenase-like lactoylglutathione lyase family enzyme